MISGMIEAMGPLGAAAVLLLSKVAIVVGLAWVVAAGMRRSSAGSRHMVWAGAVLALLALPLLTITLPRWELPIVAEPLVAGAPPVSGGVQTFTAPEISQTGAPSTMIVSSGADLEQTAGATVSPLGVPPRPVDWFGWFFRLWAIGTVVLLVRVLVGWWGVRAFARDAEPVTEGEWTQLMKDVTWLLDVHRPVKFLRSRTASMPVTWGTLAPVVLLPADASSWSAERRRVVLLHEVAHVARYDCFTQMLASIGCALYWFHPLAWVAARRLRVERERACDDMVLEAGERASEYAGHLLEVARSFRPAAPVGIAAIAMARPSQLEGRLLAVLDGARRRGTPGPRARAMGLIAIALILFPLAAARAVAADDPATEALAIAEADGSSRPAMAEVDNGRWSGSPTANSGLGTGTEDVTRTAADSVLEMRIGATPGDAVDVELLTGARLSVVGWDREEVFVRGELNGDFLDEVDVRLERSNGRVRLVSRYTVDRRSRRGDHSFEVFVPSRSDLQLRSGGGNVTIRSVTGALSGSTGGGAIALANTAGRANLRTGGGNIQVADSNLEGEVSTGGGNVRFSSVRGSLQARTGGGNISVEDELVPLGSEVLGQRPLSFVTGGGEIAVGRALAPLDLETGGGAIRVASARGAVRAETGGGTIRIGEVGGGVNAATGSGAITIERAAGPVRANTGAGAVHVGVASQNAYSDINIDTGDGSITLVLPNDFSGVFDIQSSPRGRSGAIVSDFPITVTDGGRAAGSVGSGTNIVRIRAQNGTVRIQRGGADVAMRNAGVGAAAVPPPRPAPDPRPAPHPLVDVDLARLDQALQHEIAAEVHVALNENVDVNVDPDSLAKLVQELSSVTAVQTSIAVTSAVNTGLKAAIEALRSLDPASWIDED